MEVREHQIRLALRNNPQHLSRVGRLCFNFDIWFIFEQAPHTLAQEHVVMRQNTTNLLTAPNVRARTQEFSLVLARENAEAAKTSVPLQRTFRNCTRSSSLLLLKPTVPGVRTASTAQ